MVHILGGRQLAAITLKSLADALRQLAEDVEAGRFGDMQPLRRRRGRRPAGTFEQSRVDAVREFLAGRTEVTTGDIAANVFHMPELTRSMASQMGWLMKRVEGWRKVRTNDGWVYRRVEKSNGN